MEHDNRDLFPSEATRELFTAVAPLLVHPLLATAFATREAAAQRAKRRYHRFGRLGLVCVIGGAVFTIAEALLWHAPPRALGIAAAIVAFCGLAVQIVLIATGQKRVWLNNRFAAERLRSINFQAYALAGAVDGPAALDAATSHFYAHEIALLDNELDAAESVLRVFSPAAALARVPDAPRPPVAPALAVAAAEAYAELRTRYQSRFAAEAIERLQSELRADYTVADMLYMCGALATVAALVCKALVGGEAPPWLHWVDFVAVATFILGLGKTLADNASLSEESRARFLDYHHRLQLAQRHHGDLGATIAEVERAALDELREFCQSANRISYRL